jgi:zinc transport system permease protein
MTPTPTWEDFVGAFDLFRDPILCGVAAGAVLGYLGIFIVLRRMVFVAATLTQAAGLGVALSFYCGIHLGLSVNPIVGAMALCLATSGLLSLRPERLHQSRDAILALAWLIAGSATILVGDRITQEAHDIAGILFGSGVLVRPIDLMLVLVLGGITLFIGIWWQRGFLLTTFDADGSRVQGLPVRLLELTLLVLITMSVSVCTRALGALPVFAFSVLPAMAAMILVPNLRWAFPLATLFGAAAGGLGYLAAFFLSFPVGASQTAAATALVLLAIPVRLIWRAA